MSNSPLFDPPAEPQRHKSDNAGRVQALLSDRHGHKQPLSIRALHSITGLSERTIKDSVAELIMEHGLAIGASRDSENFGYFMIETEIDLAIATLPYQAQVRTMVRRLRVLVGDSRVKTWLKEMAESI